MNTQHILGENQEGLIYRIQIIGGMKLLQIFRYNKDEISHVESQCQTIYIYSIVKLFKFRNEHNNSEFNKFFLQIMGTLL